MRPCASAALATSPQSAPGSASSASCVWKRTSFSALESITIPTLNECLTGERVSVTAHCDLEVALVRVRNDPDNIFDRQGLHDSKRHPMT